MAEEKKPRSGLARVFGNWFVRYTVLLVAILFSGYALAQAYNWGKPPAGEPPDISPAVVGTVYQSTPAVTETETDPNPVAAKPPQRPVPPGPAAPVVWSVPLNQRAVFITIDDGWFPSQGVLALMQQYHLPVTAFLIQKAAAEHAAYWQEFLKAGGQIEDHTYSHPFLTRIPESQDLTQIADPVNYFKTLGASPDELRPPYGDYDAVVQKVAAQAGIKYVVMWDAVMTGGKLTTANGRPLAPGDIILLHWVPGLDGNLVTLLHMLQQQNLGVASLGDALDGRPVRITWLHEKGAVKTQSPPAATSTSVYSNVYTRPQPAPKPKP
ncbi:MAG TPA: polysaccharide deacetylase family protein [Spirochaetia bacterium]|nr:polysaccharide deacetylase family protein [Spirochaetia bacterium]